MERTPISRITLTNLCLAASLCGVFLGMGLAEHFTERPTASVAANAALSIPAPTPVATSTLRMLFVGDMFFDRQIRFVSGEFGQDYPFSCIDPLLQSADFVVGNLEGPITANPSLSFGTIPGSVNNYTFTFPTTTAATLTRHNIRAVTLGNNHILNFGYSGLVQTQQYLARAGVGYFGGIAGDEPVYRVDQNGVRLSFVGYNSFGGASAQTVAGTIAQERAQGREVIVFAHWGVEYSTSTTTTRPAAELFAESGASAIVGSHPHVVGPHEWIGSTLVYYSLGNFIFDQYFNSGVTHGLALMLTFTPQGVAQVEEYPIVLHRSGQTCLNK